MQILLSLTEKSAKCSLCKKRPKRNMIFRHLKFYHKFTEWQAKTKKNYFDKSEISLQWLVAAAGN